MSKYNIEIGKGMGSILFGLDKATVKEKFGEPNEQDLYNLSEEEDGFLTESWHYDEQEFSVSFDEEDNWRLTTITTSHNDALLQNKPVMGLSWENLNSTIDTTIFGEYEIQDLSDEHVNQTCYSFIESSLNLWFLDGELSEIQWGVLWEDEDSPLWP